MLRVLICGETPGYAAALRPLFEYDGDISVVACQADPAEAVALLASTAIDMIAIDMGPRQAVGPQGQRQAVDPEGLPGASGLAAVEEIMSSRPLPVLVLLPAVQGKAELADAALAAGAVDAIAKDEINPADPASPAGAAFRDRVRLLARAKVIRHPRASLRRRSTTPGQGRGAAAIGFCASTGGPTILASMLAALPPGYPIPLLVVQHISAGFTPGLVSWLDQAAGLPVRVAEHGALAGQGAWIAPEDADLRLGSAGRLELDKSATGSRYRPSGDVLLTSIAAEAGHGAVAVVLSGMGTDGASGVAAVRRAGGFAIAQDEQSSAVYGMPKAAAESGVNLVLPPAEIVSYLAGLRHQPLAGTS